MTIFKLIGLVISFSLALSACTKTINPEEFFEEDTFILRGKVKSDAPIDRPFVIDTINENTPNWEKIKRLLCENRTEWRNTYASYISDIWLSQEAFTLSIKDQHMVLRFKNKEGKQTQLIKKIAKEEFEFLY
ncbi:MAG: hypothetical protein ABJ004_18425 [Cyclobacteriaceae bacterium]